MTELRVALDLASTLAATCDVAFDLLGVGDEYGYGDIESWEWGRQEFGVDEYLNALWHSWTLRPDEIEPMEPNISLYRTTLLLEQLDVVERLDIVTGHPDHRGIYCGKQEWLDEHGVQYDGFVVSAAKASHDYNVYIDDNPNLVSAVAHRSDTAMLLYDQRYNRPEEVAADADEYTRVESLTDVRDELLELEVPA